MENDRPEGFSDQGVWWQGSREELVAWKAYKRQKAVAFVERGYSVEWFPDGDNWLTVYLPERQHAGRASIRADVKFFSEPSEFGINSGRISKLSVDVRGHLDLGDMLNQTTTLIDRLYNYDRGLEYDRLDTYADARKLYDAVIEELG